MAANWAASRLAKTAGVMLASAAGCKPAIAAGVIGCMVALSSAAASAGVIFLDAINEDTICPMPGMVEVNANKSGAPGACMALSEPNKICISSVSFNCPDLASKLATNASMVCCVPPEKRSMPERTAKALPISLEPVVVSFVRFGSAVTSFKSGMPNARETTVFI